jgi:hypothetical protein
MSDVNENDDDELESRLPGLPPALVRRSVEVTKTTFVAWDIMEPWGITGVAFLRDNQGELTAWTPGCRLDEWVWRGPSHLPKGSNGDLALWLAQKANTGVTAAKSGIGNHIQRGGRDIRLWDPDPESEKVLGILRLREGGFELSLMMAGLRRGGAHITAEEGDLLAQWLVSGSTT